MTVYSLDSQIAKIGVHSTVSFIHLVGLDGAEPYNGKYTLEFHETMTNRYKYDLITAKEYGIHLAKYQEAHRLLLVQQERETRQARLHEFFLGKRPISELDDLDDMIN